MRARQALAVVVDSISMLAQDIQREHDAAQQCGSDAVNHAIACGRLLLQQKAAMQHGEFGKWLAANVTISRDTVVAYMRAASVSPQILSTAKNLSIRKLLAIPKKQLTPAPGRREATPQCKDAQAKRILFALTQMKQSELSDPAWFAGQLHFHASRLNPLKMRISK